MTDKGLEAITPDLIDEFLCKLDAFENTIYHIQKDFSLCPKKNHTGVFIKHLDLSELRDEFLNELTHTACDFVYNSAKQKSVLSTLSKGRSASAAHSELLRLVKRKFRHSHPQGQFGELLLFLFLQLYFKAIPLLRKMPIATNPAIERFGADAIHLAKAEDKSLLYLGEAKSYTSKYSFNQAFKQALKSIISSYDQHRKELDLYVYDDFITPELLTIAQAYKSGTIKHVEVHLVNVLVTHTTNQPKGKTQDDLNDEMVKVITDACCNLPEDTFSELPDALLPRLNYIIFPVRKFDDLMKTFGDIMRA